MKSEPQRYVPNAKDQRKLFAIDPQKPKDNKQFAYVSVGNGKALKVKAR
jgi:hypothetical protein